MSLPLLNEWRVYARLNPFGEQRADWRAAMIGSVIGNRVGGLYGKKRPRAFKIDDLLPKFDIREKKTAKAIYEMIRMYAILNMKAENKPRRES